MMRKAITMNFFVFRCLRNLALAAMVVGGMVASQANAGVVYTTSTTAGAVAYTNNVQAYANNSGDQTLNFTNNGGTTFGWTPTTNQMGVRFTAGGSTGQQYKLTSFAAVFTIEKSGPTAPTWTDATFVWSLWKSTNTTTSADAIYNSSWGALATTPTNQNWNKDFTMTGSGTNFNLTQGETYNLILTNVIVSGGTNLNNADIHWQYTTAAGIGGNGNGWTATGGDFTNTGGLTGLLTPTNPAPNPQTLVFSLDATAVPEPSTLILYSAAAGGFFVFSFLRWRKSKTILEVVAAQF